MVGGNAQGGGAVVACRDLVDPLARSQLEATDVLLPSTLRKTISYDAERRLAL